MIKNNISINKYITDIIHDKYYNNILTGKLGVVISYKFMENVI